MSDDFGLSRVDRWGRGILPLVSLICLVLLSVTHLPLPAYSILAPSLPLMGIYCWVVLRPDLMPRGAIFAVGLLQDALTGFPLGVHAFVYTVAHPLLIAQRRFLVRHAFLSLWWGFALLAPSASFLTWTTLSVLRGGLVPPFGIFASLAVAIVAFPVVAWLITKMRGILPPAAETVAYA